METAGEFPVVPWNMTVCGLESTRQEELLKHSCCGPSIPSKPRKFSSVKTDVFDTDGVA